jgi:hypothetical protein
VQRKDDVLRLRKALLRLLCVMLPRDSARHPHQTEQDDAFSGSVLSAIHEIAQSLLPRLQSEAGDGDHWRQADLHVDVDSGERERERERKRVRTSEPLGGQPTFSSIMPMPTTITTATEACTVLAFVFAKQARREIEMGTEKVVREYVRVMAALSALPFAGQDETAATSPFLCDERQWDRRRRRCLPWLRQTVRTVWAMVVEGQRRTERDTVWPVGRAMVRYGLAYSFVLPLEDRRHIVHDLFTACSAVQGTARGQAREGINGSEATQPRPLRDESADWAASAPKLLSGEKEKEKGFGEAGLLEILAHHVRHVTQALVFLRVRHALPSVGTYIRFYIRRCRLLGLTWSVATQGSCKPCGWLRRAKLSSSSVTSDYRAKPNNGSLPSRPRLSAFVTACHSAFTLTT